MFTPAQRVAVARHEGSPGTADYIAGLFTDFFEQRGDRQCREDPSILGGIALFHGRPVTVIGTRKGKNLQENLKFNFGMPGPEGYRKALRLMRQAEKFERPVITLIDTPGAYPGLEAEARGQGEAIARNLFEMSQLTVPIVAVITGEGNSGGALALGVANSAEACELMKLTAEDLLAQGVIDGIIPEPAGGAHCDPAAQMAAVDQALASALNGLQKISELSIAGQRYKKIRAMGGNGYVEGN